MCKMKVLKLKNNINNGDVRSIVEKYLIDICKIPQKLLKNLVITDIRQGQVLYKCTNVEIGRAHV